MTRRTFAVIDIVEVLVHWHAGRKKSEVARSLGVDRGTVHKYVAHAESEGYSPGDRIVPSSSGGHSCGVVSRAGRREGAKSHPRRDRGAP